MIDFCGELMQKRTIKRSSQTGRFTQAEIKSVVKAVHVVPSAGGWKVMKAGQARVMASFETKRDAIKYAKTLSRDNRVDLVTHLKTGRIERKNSYGNDPRPPKG
jgi:Uncharacterized protein conserved in bacteria (DUF2188)